MDDNELMNCILNIKIQQLIRQKHEKQHKQDYGFRFTKHFLRFNFISILITL